MDTFQRWIIWFIGVASATFASNFQNHRLLVRTSESGHFIDELNAIHHFVAVSVVFVYHDFCDAWNAGEKWRQKISIRNIDEAQIWC